MMSISPNSVNVVDTAVRIAQATEGVMGAVRGSDDFDYWFEQCEILCELDAEVDWMDSTQVNRYRHALESRERAIAFDPDDALAWTNQGVILQRLERYAEALISHDRALNLVPNYALAWNNRGVVLERLGRSAEAIASYERALELDPSSELARQNRNNLLQWLGF